MNHCGVLNCPREGTSLDRVYGRLCGLHEKRVRDDGYDRIERPGDELLLRPPDLLVFDERTIKLSICEPDLDVRLRPLLLFAGPHTIGKAIRAFNYTRILMAENVLDLNKGLRSLNLSDDPKHLLGFHSKLDKMVYNRFLARLRDTPQVHDLVPGLKEYVRELMHNNPGWYFSGVRLPEISEYRIRSDRYWRAPAKKDRQPREYITEFYPYIKGEPTDDHALLLAVEQLVPKTLSNDVRGDICQDMLVAILTGEVTLDNLRDERPKHLKRLLKGHPLKYGHLSLDAPVGYGDERTLGQKLGL